MWLIKTDQYMFQTTNKTSYPTKSNKHMYIQLKIICMLRIINMHERHIMKNPAKVLGLHKSPSYIFQSHNIHREISSNISWVLHTHIQNTPTNVLAFMHTLIHT